MHLHTLNSLLLCSAHVQGYSLCFPLGRTCQAESTSGCRDCCAALTPEAPNTFTSEHRPIPACQNATQQERGPTDGQSPGIGSDVALHMCEYIYIYIYVSVFSPKTKPQRDGCQSEAWWGLVGGWERWCIKRWTGAVGVEWITMNWQLMFKFFLCRTKNPWHFGQKVTKIKKKNISICWWLKVLLFLFCH